MKTARIFCVPLLLILLFCSSCVPEECRDGYNLPDLIISDCTIDERPNSDTIIDYVICWSVTNSAEAISCVIEKRRCSSIDSVNLYTTRCEIYYSDSIIPTVDWGAPIHNESLIGPGLEGCESDVFCFPFRFESDGYYLIVSFADIENTIVERDESNNGNANLGGHKKASGTPLLLKVVNGDAVRL